MRRTLTEKLAERDLQQDDRQPDQKQHRAVRHQEGDAVSLQFAWEPHDVRVREVQAQAEDDAAQQRALGLETGVGEKTILI